MLCRRLSVALNILLLVLGVLIMFVSDRTRLRQTHDPALADCSTASVGLAAGRAAVGEQTGKLVSLAGALGGMHRICRAVWWAVYCSSSGAQRLHWEGAGD
jgi:hypothetical protein